MRLLTPYELWFRCTHPWLRPLFRIASHLTFREKIALYRIVGHDLQTDTRPISIVEVGSYRGASSLWMAAGLRDNGLSGKIYCIDTWNNDAMSEGPRDTMAEFLHNTQQFASFIVPLRGMSADPLMVDRVRRKTDRIDLLFIDGDHSFEGVLADWKAYSSMLIDRSIVALHDVGWAEGVQRVVANEIKPMAVSEGRLPNLWWARVKR